MCKVTFRKMVTEPGIRKLNNPDLESEPLAPGYPLRSFCPAWAAAQKSRMLGFHLTIDSKEDPVSGHGALEHF